MSATFFSRVYEALKSKGIVVHHHHDEDPEVNLEILILPFKKYMGPVLEDLNYCVRIAMRDNHMAFIITAAMYPLNDINPRYSKDNGMKLLTTAKQLLSNDVPYLTEGEDIPITWEIEERTSDTGQGFLSLEGSCQLVSDDIPVDEFVEFMEGWEDFPVVEFEEQK